MSHTDWRTRLGLFQATALLAATLLLTTGCGQPAAATPKTADAKTAEKDTAAMTPMQRQAGSDAKDTELAMADITDAPAGDIRVPNGTPAELFAFIQELQKAEPQSNSREAFRAELAARAKAINKAADKILASPNLDEPMRVATAQAKLGALVQNIDEPEGLQALRKYINSVAKDKDPQLAASAQKLLKDLPMASIQRGDDTDAPAVLADIKSRLAGDKINMGELIDQVLPAAETLEMAEPPTLAMQAYAAILKALDKIDPAILARPEAKQGVDQIREMAESSTRRLQRIGKPLEIEGTLLDGKPLDWSKYRGKVVLVDFWATWCGPCLQELPNVKENYLRFHDKGFDVLGVSLDEDRADVVALLKREEVPWPTLFSDNPQGQGWNNPLVRKFDINGIPATFLVDREGKLISMAARGPRLTAQLQRLLGSPK